MYATEEELALEEGDEVCNELRRCAEEGRLAIGDRVLHDSGTPWDEGGDGIRPGTVQGIQPDGSIRVKFDAMHLDRCRLKSEEKIIDKLDNLSKAPPETSLKAGDWVRVAQDCKHINGMKWQYGRVRWVYHKLLLDVNYDGGHEFSRGIPAFAHEVQPAQPWA